MEQAISKGLEGVVVAESQLCFIDGEKGKLLYRGYNIGDLARSSNFEEVTCLLLYGKLPTKRELSHFVNQLALRRQMPEELLELMKVYGRNSIPMDSLRTSVSLLANYDSEPANRSPEKNLERGIGLVAVFPTLVAADYRIKKGLKPIDPAPELSQAGNFLYMLHGKAPDEVSTRALDTDLVLHAEHGFNASTFAARVTISTLSDMYSAIVSAIGTLKGPLHGGAAGKVLEMLKKIGSAENAEHWVKETLSRKERITGFGHRVYKTVDPRAIHLKRMSKELAERTGDSHFFNISDKLEEAAVALCKAEGVCPNVDFYSGIVYGNLKIPEELSDSIFTIGRISGWVAHVLEQLADNRLIRPRERYTGPMDLPYIPIDQRR